jgi:hypothetical protein
MPSVEVSLVAQDTRDPMKHYGDIFPGGPQRNHAPFHLPRHNYYTSLPKVAGSKLTSTNI